MLYWEAPLSLSSFAFWTQTCLLHIYLLLWGQIIALQDLVFKPEPYPNLIYLIIKNLFFKDFFFFFGGYSLGILFFFLMLIPRNLATELIPNPFLSVVSQYCFSYTWPFNETVTYQPETHVDLFFRLCCSKFSLSQSQCSVALYLHGKLFSAAVTACWKWGLRVSFLVHWLWRSPHQVLRVSWLSGSVAGVCT